MATAQVMDFAMNALLRRETTDADEEGDAEAGQKEIYASWSLFILIMLLIAALITSYILQTRKIQAVHETVISIFAGMVVGLTLQLTLQEESNTVLRAVTFDYQMFFNLLLPPIILNSGYELHQSNFFRNIGTILTFAFAGTFISALALGIILFLWSMLPIQPIKITFVEAMSVGATLSATDPVTILAIFNSYKVDPKLYTIIFGESILNDAIAIVLFETAQKYRSPPDLDSTGDEAAQGGHLTILTLFESIGYFILVFFGSLVIGVLIGIATSLLLKLTHIRRYPKIESCLIILIAYASYFFANAIHMSGIVSLLFCGICMKHYAYHNMSRRTQLTTKFIFQVLAQLSENFIFIYLGLSLFADKQLDYKPLFILIAVVGICVARWLAVFPLSRAVNWIIRYRGRRQGRDTTDAQIPYNHQVMLYWAGLRGAVGVALAAGLTGENGKILRSTVLVVVVLTVIIFGGTTARMLEILDIRTGVVEEIDSDDEFDIEVVLGDGGTYSRQGGQGLGYNPTRSSYANGNIALDHVGENHEYTRGTYVSGNSTPPTRPNGAIARKNSQKSLAVEQSNMLSGGDSVAVDDDGDLDLPPQARKSSPYRASNNARRNSPTDQDQSHSSTSLQPPGLSQAQSQAQSHASQGVVGTVSGAAVRVASAAGAVSQLISGLSEDPANAFRQIDEEFIKPHLLLDPKGGKDGGGDSGV